MAIDLLLSKDTNDLVISTPLGDVTKTSSKKELLRQKISITFQTFVGEWYLNTTFGLIDRSVFFSKPITKAELDAFIVVKLNAFTEVLEIKSFSSTFDTANRQYSVTFTVRTDEGNVNLFVAVTPAGQEIEYPTNATELSATSCELPTVDNSNTYYEMIHLFWPESFGFTGGSQLLTEGSAQSEFGLVDEDDDPITSENILDA